MPRLLRLETSDSMPGSSGARVTSLSVSEFSATEPYTSTGDLEG